jgi:(p)ppGpp synthase/HD superfamily hydrolase
MIADPLQLEVEENPSIEEMPFTVPLHSRKQVNRAGENISHLESEWWRDQDKIAAYYANLDIVNNWRSSHSGPLLYLRMLLTNHSRRVDGNALIAQRIKRLSSIELKLQRFPTMTLSQMQDIGGCRAIVDSVSSVKEISTNVQKSRTQHEFNTCDDYIDRPQTTGYRGIHLIYRFHSDTELKPCTGLKIEI